MIDRFRWGVCCFLVLILQLFWAPVAMVVAAERQTGSAYQESDRHKDFDLNLKIFSTASAGSDRSSQTSRLQGEGQDLDGFGQTGGAFPVPEKPGLVELIGVPEISVLADVDGQFINSMAENQIIAESARQLDETGLVESISAGRHFNRESHAAFARTEQAEAQTGQALALLLPSVSARLSYGEEVSEPSVVVDEVSGELVASNTHNRTDTTLTVRQPLFNLPSFLDWRRRQEKEQASRESFRARDGDAYISTVNTYLTLVSSRLQSDITRDFESQLAELLRYIEKRAGAGAASISDMSRVRARRQETKSARLEQDSAHLAAGIEFVRLTNIVPQKVRLPIPEDVGASLLPGSFSEAVAKAIASNPEITALTAELQAAKLHQSLAKGRFMPRLDAEYTDTYSLHAGGEPNSAGQRDKRIMLVVNWDLFSGGRDYKYHIERKARRKELLYRLDDQRRRVIQELSANYAALAATKERLASGYQELKSISTAAEAMSQRMLSGNQSLLDLLTVYDRYFKVRSRLVTLHIFEMNTVAQLIRLTTGTPWASTQDASFADDRS